MGNPNRGYNVTHIIDEISSILGMAKIRNVGLIGVGNLGRAILSYFVGRRPDLPIVASFDNDKDKQGRVISGCHCLSIEKLEETIAAKEIKIILLAMPPERVQELVNRCIAVGIKSFVNFSHIPLRVPAHVFVENIDITLTIEKAGHFAD
jgi:redox-sensing transcriptional repressor